MGSFMVLSLVSSVFKDFKQEFKMYLRNAALLWPVILKRFFCAKDLPRCLGLHALASLVYPKFRLTSGGASSEHVCPKQFREILRPKPGLRMTDVSILFIQTYAPQRPHRTVYKNAAMSRLS